MCHAATQNAVCDTRFEGKDSTARYNSGVFFKTQIMAAFAKVPGLLDSKLHDAPATPRGAAVLGKFFDGRAIKESRLSGNTAQSSWEDDGVMTGRPREDMTRSGASPASLGEGVAMPIESRSHPAVPGTPECQAQGSPIVSLHH